MSAAAAVLQRRRKLKSEIVRISSYYQAHPTTTLRSASMIDLTLRCPVCGRRADMCFEHGDDWKKRHADEAGTWYAARCSRNARKPNTLRRPTMFTSTATLWGVKTSKLEQIVSEARQTYGPHKQRWPLAALRAFDELTKRHPGF